MDGFGVLDLSPVTSFEFSSRSTGYYILERAESVCARRVFRESHPILSSTLLLLMLACRDLFILQVRRTEQNRLIMVQSPRPEPERKWVRVVFGAVSYLFLWYLVLHHTRLGDGFAGNVKRVLGEAGYHRGWIF